MEVVTAGHDERRYFVRRKPDETAVAPLGQHDLRGIENEVPRGAIRCAGIERGYPGPLAVFPPQLFQWSFCANRVESLLILKLRGL